MPQIRGVELASKFPTSQSNQASVGCAGQMIGIEAMIEIWFVIASEDLYIVWVRRCLQGKTALYNKIQYTFKAKF